MNLIPSSRHLRFVLIGSVALLLVAGCAGQQTEPPASPPAESESVDDQEQPDEDRTVEEAAPEKTEPAVEDARPAMPQSVSDYSDLANRSYTAPEGKEKYDHAFTADRFRGLATALEDSAEGWDLSSNQRETIEGKIQTLRRVADHIQEKRIVPHSESVLKGLRAGREAVELFVGKGETRNGDLASIADSVEAFDSEVVLLKQKTVIETYFKRTARALEKLYG